MYKVRTQISTEIEYVAALVNQSWSLNNKTAYCRPVKVITIDIYKIAGLHMSIEEKFNQIR